jgi:NitT/TauT family transport system substrate-binding protein
MWGGFRRTRLAQGLTAGVVAIAGLGLVACGSDEKAGGSAASGSEKAAPVKVQYLTSFGNFGRDAYVHVAKEKGFFEEAGLDVDIKPGSGTADVVKLVAAGRADFGIGEGATTLITIANQGLKLKTVAAIQQHTMNAIAFRASEGIKSPADLVGKKIADAPASATRILFPYYAKKAGIDPEKVQFIPSAPPDAPKLLAAKRVDAVGQFVVGKGLLEAAAKEPVEFLPYSDQLPDIGGNLLMTSSKMIDEQPEVVEKFVKALLRGLEYSIENPDETGEILAKVAPEQNPKVAAAEVKLMTPFVRPEGFDGAIGYVDEKRLQAEIDLLTEAGAIEKPVKLDDLYAGGFVE